MWCPCFRIWVSGSMPKQRLSNLALGQQRLPEDPQEIECPGPLWQLALYCSSARGAQGPELGFMDSSLVFLPHPCNSPSSPLLYPSPPHNRWECWGIDTFNHLPQSTRLVRSSVGIWTQASGFKTFHCRVSSCCLYNNIRYLRWNVVQLRVPLAQMPGILVGNWNVYDIYFAGK